MTFFYLLEDKGLKDPEVAMGKPAGGDKRNIFFKLSLIPGGIMEII